MHSLDIYGDGEPAIGYDPSQVGVTWLERRRASSAP
jgi:hypothetical protein